MNLAETLTGCKNKNRTAQKRLYTYVFENLYHIPSRYTKTKEHASDIFNEAMLKIFNSLHNEVKIESFLGWCHTIIFRTTLDHLRKQNLFHSRFEQVGDYSDHGSHYQVDDLLNDLDTEEIFAAIRALSEKEIAVFSLYEIDGYKHQEIGEVLGISTSNSKYILSTAKKNLRNRLSHLGYANQKI